MAEIIRDVHDLFHPIAQEKGVMLVPRIPDHVHVQGDLHGLQRMAVNLVENAIKYTPSGGTVTISLKEEHGDMLFAVQDTGIGISERDLPHIFRRRYRCETSRSESGFGLGLSLALAVARAHGGDITATSRPGEGSTFTVSIPKIPHSS